MRTNLMLYLVYFVTDSGNYREPNDNAKQD